MIDNKTKYQEAIKRIQETDAISFKLLGMVPVISGGAVITLSSGLLQVPDVILYLASILGTLSTYFVYRWELRNIQFCNALRDYVLTLEGDDSPYKTIDLKPGLFKGAQSKGWGKTEAIRGIYWISIFFWLLFPVGLNFDLVKIDGQVYNTMYLFWMLFVVLFLIYIGRLYFKNNS